MPEVPTPASASERVGSKTRRGIGALASTTPHEACAGTSTVLFAVSNPKNVAFSLLVILTFTNGFEVIELGGMHTFIPTGIGLGHIGTGVPVNVVGKVT
jgi:hypothetical protein